jgi:hypothetical protein
MSILSMKTWLVTAMVALVLILTAVLVVAANFPDLAHIWGDSNLTLERADVHMPGDVS